MKKPMLESLFNKAVGLKSCNFIKQKFQRRCFCVKFAKFKSTCFEECLRTTAPNTSRWVIELLLKDFVFLMNVSEFFKLSLYGSISQYGNISWAVPSHYIWIKKQFSTTVKLIEPTFTSTTWPYYLTPANKSPTSR